MGRHPHERPDREAAERLAVAALGFLAEQPEALGRFLALTGIGPANLRRAALDQEFLTGVIDFLLGDEPLLLAFAAHAEIPPDRVAAIGRLLSPPL